MRVPRRAFLVAASVVNALPDEPKKVRTVAAFRLAQFDTTGRATRSISDVTFDLDLSDWLQRLYALGATEPGKRAALESLVPPGGSFIDIGANIGLFTCTMARHVGPKGSVI